MAHDWFPEVGVESILDIGDPRAVLAELAETAAMVVTGSRGHGRIVWLLLGSVSAALVRHVSCPIAIVRPAGEGRQGVLVGCDGTDASATPLEHAFAEASARNLPVTVVHCLWRPVAGHLRWGHVATNDPEFEPTRLRISEALSRPAEKYPDVPVSVSITRGAIEPCLIDLSEQHDLLVIGRPPHSLGERLDHPGLVLTIAEHAHAPVVVVP